MKTFFAIVALSLISYGLFAQGKKSRQLSTIVLVHGAWSDSSAWNAVVPLLKAKGHKVINVNLPGHGTDGTSFADITFQSYVDAVKTAIGEQDNIILVGHSMAGMVISQVAEDIPTQIRELIYIAALLPKDGQSLLDLAKTDADAHTGKYLQIDQEHGAAIIAKEGIVDVFFEDAPKEVADQITANWKAEPLAPLATPVKLSEKFSAVKKVYIFTEKDHSISYQLQQRMVQATPVAKSYSLHSSHTPFISMPVKLADLLSQVSR